MSELHEAMPATPDPLRAPPTPAASAPTSALGADASDADVHDDTRHGDPVHIAWRLLTSPRTFLGLTALLAAFFAWSTTLPARATPGELSRVMSFAEAELASALGATDPLTSPVFILGVLLLGVVGVGLLLARRRDAGPFVRRTEVFIDAPIEVVRARVPKGVQLGLRREGAVIAALGIVALLIALAVARSSGLEARIQVTPGDRTGEQTSATVLDAGIYVPRAFSRTLRCASPDPLDASRGYDCELASATDPASEALKLRAGEPATAGDITFALVRGTPRFPGRSEIATFVLTRGDAPPELVELGAAPVALSNSGERLQMFSGPDGPLVLVAGPGHAPYLLVPTTAADAPAGAAKPPLTLAYAPPRDLTVRATTSPELPLFWAGLCLIAIGLFLIGVWPSVRLQLEANVKGTRAICWSTNDADRAARILDALRPTESS